MTKRCSRAAPQAPVHPAMVDEAGAEAPSNGGEAPQDDPPDPRPAGLSTPNRLAVDTDIEAQQQPRTKARLLLGLHANVTSDPAPGLAAQDASVLFPARSVL